jgi:lipoprotein-anchoring transpeptidase ErfK/SrfK
MSHFDSTAALNRAAAIVWIVGVLSVGTSALGGPLGYGPSDRPYPIFEQFLQDRGTSRNEQEAVEVPAHLRRQTVAYQTREAPGTIVIDTPNTQLYYVLSGGKAIRYGIGVGREGFTWSGVQTISRKIEWPDWTPPAEMLERQPYLPRFMAGGPGNPLGARAMYLGGTVYRIHGTNAPETIGGQVSSGCLRMLNEDVIDLYGRVNIGTKVVVLPANPRVSADLTVRSRRTSEARPVVASRGSIQAFGLY